VGTRRDSMSIVYFLWNENGNETVPLNKSRTKEDIKNG
jgi:hypothetical protein